MCNCHAQSAFHWDRGYVPQVDWSDLQRRKSNSDKSSKSVNDRRARGEAMPIDAAISAMRPGFVQQDPRYFHVYSKAKGGRKA